jgi:pre-mRNA cleavage complex 2 protein Pcf11
MLICTFSSPRVALVVSLYEAKPNRCGTCGRRFPSTQEGKEKKARHLDWHFKTNQRMSEAAKRAQTRSWYVDERVCTI